MHKMFLELQIAFSFYLISITSNMLQSFNINSVKHLQRFFFNSNSSDLIINYLELGQKWRSGTMVTA